VKSISAPIGHPLAWAPFEQPFYRRAAQHALHHPSAGPPHKLPPHTDTRHRDTLATALLAVCPPSRLHRAYATRSLILAELTAPRTCAPLSPYGYDFHLNRAGKTERGWETDHEEEINYLLTDSIQSADTTPPKQLHSERTQQFLIGGFADKDRPETGHPPPARQRRGTRVDPSP